MTNPDIQDWLDDAADYSSEGTSHVTLELASWDDKGHLIHTTDFRISPAQAKAMFFAIAGQENNPTESEQP